MSSTRDPSVVSAVAALLLGAAAAAEPPRWAETGMIPAPEAHQAAAADGRFVYAIDGPRVAKYDRATGRRLAASTGRATHLNSGFFRDGTLYLAHSNYPKTPEKSEILALDPDTMTLSTYHDFGEAGGSLTWAVYEEEPAGGGSWWCNFARYGDANAETFLARFDDRWRETGRWTYPPEVVRRLRRQSVSGGVWRDGKLLVTGHDDPVLFRLRLPMADGDAAGGVLAFVAAEPAPFTGQGIAADPVTGGLVGIRRDRKQIVFASPEPDDGR